MSAFDPKRIPGGESISSSHQDRKNAPGLASAMKHSNELSSDAMSTLGTKWKFQSKLRMSAFRGKADMSPNDPKRTVLDLGPIA
jgi:hypothetical protein